MGTKYKYVKVDRELCIGAASCIAVYPEVFELDAENKAVMLKKDGTKTSDDVDIDLLNAANVDDDMLLMAAQSCPTAAIFLYDSDRKQLYPEI